MNRSQSLRSWYTSHKWEFWIGTVGVGIALAFLSAFLGGDDTTANSLNIEEMNGGVVNAHANIENQAIYFANQTDPSIDNPRPPELRGLRGKELIARWFELMEEQNWRAACSLMSKHDCDAGNWESINTAFHFMKERTFNGYEDPQIQHASDAPSNIWCVRYHYTMAQTEVHRRIVEIMQYKLGRREDGDEEIVTKLCERQWKEGIGYTDKCAKPPLYYCSDLNW